MIIEIIKAVYDSKTGKLDVVLSDGARRVLVENVENIERDQLLREFYSLARWSAANVKKV
jgi:hypothetical protein